MAFILRHPEGDFIVDYTETGKILSNLSDEELVEKLIHADSRLIDLNSKERERKEWKKRNEDI